MWRKLFDVLFWLGVSAYFGGMLALGMIVAPGVFKTVREGNMSMPGILVPPLEMSGQVGGEIFGVILNRFAAVEAAMLSLILIAIVGWMLSYRGVRRSTWVIATLWALLVGVALYDTYAVRSKVWEVRKAVRDTAAAHLDYKDGMTNWPEKVEFDVLHKRSESVGKIKVYLLMAMLGVAAWRGSPERKQTGGFRRMRVMTPVP